MKELIDQQKNMMKSETLAKFPIDKYEKKIRNDEIKGVIWFILRITLCVIVSLVILSWI